MRTAFVALLLSALVQRGTADEFARSSTFESVESFVTAASQFLPRTSKSDLARLFTVRIRDGGPPSTLVTAPAIESSSALWSNESSALVFVTASPSTDADPEMPSAVGVAFLLSRNKTKWHIADLKRFSALGKYANVTAKISGEGRDHDLPIFTVTEAHGGRGVYWTLCATYHIDALRLKRMELE
jgi:hypothetical protein